MRHLNDHLDEAALVDAAEHSQSEYAAHLSECERCRGQVEELRALIRVAEDVPVPEPSPLFWDHLSARVRQAVADEPGSRVESFGWAARWWNWQVLASAVAVSAIVVAVAVGRRAPTPTVSVELRPAPDPAAAAALEDLTLPFDKDPSLSFIADLASDLDWDDAVEAGLTTGAGSVDRVVIDMSDDERRELQRVLREAMGQRGA
jgi:hypothetical protein